MLLLNDILKKYSTLKFAFRSIFILTILFLIFFAVNLFISMNKKESAYNKLTIQDENTKAMLQDTRLHNWSEIDEKKR